MKATKIGYQKFFKENKDLKNHILQQQKQQQKRNKKNEYVTDSESENENGNILDNFDYEIEEIDEEE